MSKPVSESQFEKLFKSNFTAITAYCAKTVKDTDAAKDLAHNTFMKIWEKRYDLDYDNNLVPLIYRIARNLSLNYIRDNKKFTDETALTNIEGENNETDAEIETSQTEATIARTIQNMPKKKKKVFIMSRLDGMSNIETAQKLGISIKTVEAHITQALKLLRSKLSVKEIK